MLPPLLLALCCIGGLGLFTMVVLLAQLRGYNPRPFLPLIIGFVLFITAIATLWIAPTSAEELTPGEIVLRWTRLYGQDTHHAAQLVTERFRKGQAPQKWAQEIQARLVRAGYRHLGGEIVTETVQGTQATVILQARIETLVGITIQTEVYTLQQVNGQWRIDRLTVRDEVSPMDSQAVT
jgi:hypothetical protein